MAPISYSRSDTALTQEQVIGHNAAAAAFCATAD